MAGLPTCLFLSIDTDFFVKVRFCAFPREGARADAGDATLIEAV
jgi:hypothetical protein